MRDSRSSARGCCEGEGEGAAFEFVACDEDAGGGRSDVVVVAAGHGYSALVAVSHKTVDQADFGAKGLAR